MDEAELQKRLEELEAEHRSLQERFRELAISYVQLGGVLAPEKPSERRSKSTAALTIIKGGLGAVLAWLFLAGLRKRVVSAVLAATGLTAGGVVVYETFQPTLRAPHNAPAAPSPSRSSTRPASRPGAVRRAQRGHRGAVAITSARAGHGSPSSVPSPPPPSAGPSPQPSPLPVPLPVPIPLPIPTPTVGHSPHCVLYVVILGQRVCVRHG
jgi:hypothetical protein